MLATPSRTLAVILHGDVVGSTGLVRRNETLAHERIKDLFARFSTTIQAYGGTPREIRGDALVAEFSRVSDAVCAALAFQASNTRCNASLDDDLQPVLRVGIAMGEVVIANDTVTGEGVVLAQRLEQIAGPGAVCIQGAAYETVPKRLPFVYHNLGERSLKGFDEPVRAYTVSLQAGESIPAPERGGPARPALDLPDKPSIAVLPFANMSGDREQEYFADGIVEEITLALGCTKQLFVVSKSSSFAYKNRGVDVRQIGRDLGVHYALEGSVRRAGPQVRILCELVDASNARQIWAGKFQGTLHDIFDLQDQVTAEVVAAIEPSLQAVQIERAYAKSVGNLTAYDFYLRALPKFQELSRQATTESLRHLDRALALDRDFPRAKSLAAWCYTMRRTQGWESDFDGERARALAFAREALAATGDDSQVLWQCGYALSYFDDATEEGLRLIGRALRLNPNAAQAWVSCGLMRLFLGDAAAAIGDLQRGLRLSPVDPLIFRAEAALGLANLCLANHEAATQWAERAVLSGPQYFVGHRVLAASLAWLGRDGDAQRALARFLALQPGYTLGQFEKTTPIRDPGYRQTMVQGLRRAGLAE